MLKIEFVPNFLPKKHAHSAPKPEYYFLAGPWDCFTVLKSSDHVESSDISFKM